MALCIKHTNIRNGLKSIDYFIKEYEYVKMKLIYLDHYINFYLFLSFR